MKSLKYVLISLLAATGVTPVSADGATISAGEAKQLADRVERISQKEWDDLKGIEVIVGAAEKQKIATGIEIKKGEQYLVLPCSLDRWNSSPKRWQDVDFRGHTGAKEKAKSGMPYLQMCYSIDNDPLLSLVGHYILAEEGHLFLGSSDMAGGGNINNNRGRIRVKIIQISPGTVAPPPAIGSSNTAATPPPSPAPGLPPPGSIPSDANRSPTKILSQQAPNATAWVLAPLEQSVPGDIRQNITYLREDLLDAGKAAPKAGAEAYKLGAQLCNNLLAALDARDQALVRAGYRAAQADANTKVTSQALEARRNYMMSWPQYAREKDQRGEIQRQQTNGVTLVNESVKVEWANKSAALRKSLDAQYAKYRDALRQDAK